jgi:hypothetical protein
MRLTISRNFKRLMHSIVPSVFGSFSCDALQTQDGHLKLRPDVTVLRARDLVRAVRRPQLEARGAEAVDRRFVGASEPVCGHPPGQIKGDPLMPFSREDRQTSEVPTVEFDFFAKDSKQRLDLGGDWERVVAKY